MEILLRVVEQNTRKYASEERGQSVFLQIWDSIGSVSLYYTSNLLTLI